MNRLKSKKCIVTGAGDGIGRGIAKAIARDDSAKPRPEGSNLTVAPALRLTNRQAGNFHWDLTMTEKGLVLTAKSGKFKGWYWDFGGNDPSHEESGRQVAVNVLLAEKVVAGSYFEVIAEK